MCEAAVGKTLVLADGQRLCAACYKGNTELRDRLKAEYFRATPISPKAKALDSRLRQQEAVNDLVSIRGELARIQDQIKKVRAVVV